MRTVLRHWRTVTKTQKQHEAIRLLKSLATHILLDGGSRSGKSFIFVYAIVVRALKKRSRHLILRKHFKDCKASIGMETLPKVLEILCPGMGLTPNKTDWVWTFPNGSEIWHGGLDEKERTEKVLGKEYSTILFEESSQLTWDSVTTALTRLAENSGLDLKAYYACNPPLKKHWVYQVFYEHKDPEDNRALEEEDYAQLLMNPTDNLANLPPSYLKILERMPERKRKRFLHGLYLDDVEGALWSMDIIAPYRVGLEDVPDLVRVYVGVDPAVTGKKTSDDTGIIVAGKSRDGHFYILGDYTCKGSPLKWARATIRAYKEHEADRVIARGEQRW